MTSFQSSELTELPVVENSQLFAQRAHSACTAHAQRTVRPLRLFRGRFCTARAQLWHSTGTAPIITLFIPGTPLKTTHLQKDV